MSALKVHGPEAQTEMTRSLLTLLAYPYVLSARYCAGEGGGERGGTQAARGDGERSRCTPHEQVVVSVGTRCPRGASVEGWGGGWDIDGAGDGRRERGSHYRGAIYDALALPQALGVGGRVGHNVRGPVRAAAQQTTAADAAR
ncbi:hypothetical protein B0H19DRAFT_1230302 [Mycena capillaripes]|nr:hypothetical protein B0H19DRAFT_1230302 [Mycena capillaripes]